MNLEEARRRCLKLERDRERSWRESRQGAFEASMLSLDEHMAKFDDPSKIATFSDGGKYAEAVRACGEDVRLGVVDPAVKKRLLNRLRSTRSCKRRCGGLSQTPPQRSGSRSKRLTSKKSAKFSLDQ